VQTIPGAESAESKYTAPFPRSDENVVLHVTDHDGHRAACPSFAYLEDGRFSRECGWIHATMASTERSSRLRRIFSSAGDDTVTMPLESFIWK